MDRKTASLERQKRKRCWIQRHACRELLAELSAERLSLYAALKLARLSPREQRWRLAQRRERIHSQECAAIVISQFLAAQHGAGHIDLTKLSEAITSSILKPSEVLIRSGSPRSNKGL
jgi:hypothetical protein